VTLCKSKSGETQPGETGTKPNHPDYKDVQPRHEFMLVEIVSRMVEILKKHSDRIRLLEE
jgi:hypothetical protein